MFTGLVAGLGRVITVRPSGMESRLVIQPLFQLKNIQDGESIAINGACLSVEEHAGAAFSVYASAETMSRTNLGLLAPGSEVNLEQAMILGERLGGHMVSGHVDCLAIVRGMVREGQSLRFRLSFPPEFGPQIISKGSVALDGISLTVNASGSDFLEVNVIPDSQKRTNISQWRPGSKINMETDLIGKYVLSFMRNQETHGCPGGGSRRVDSDFLATHGFL